MRDSGLNYLISEEVRKHTRAPGKGNSRIQLPGSSHSAPTQSIPLAETELSQKREDPRFSAPEFNVQFGFQFTGLSTLTLDITLFGILISALGLGFDDGKGVCPNLGHLTLAFIFEETLCVLLLQYVHAAVKSHCRTSEEFAGPWCWT